MLLSEAIALIQGAGVFDTSLAQTSDTAIRGWISTSVQEAVAEAKWLRQVRDFGPTVAGTADYTVDGDVIEVRTLRVNKSRPWSRGQLEDAWTFETSPIAALTGSQPGIFSPSWEPESGQNVDDVPQFVRLTPAPSVSGYTIEAICAVDHKVIDVATSVSYALQLPNDVARAIAVDGAIGLGITLVHQRADMAAPYIARYSAAKEKLKGRANSQIGSGPRYARVWRGGR